MQPNEDLTQDPLRFASLVAHQLQSPLNAVSASLHTVLAEYTGPLLPQQRGNLERASLRCEQAITSIRRMLAITQAQAGVLPEAPPAPLESVVRQCLGQAAEEAARHHVAVAFDARVANPRVTLGESALTEAVAALISNALKYTPDHGRVAVAIEPSPAPGCVRLRVGDSGVGIAEKDRERIFQPFYRTPAARASARPGVGLGLAFVRSVVVAAGGAVAVGRSEPGGAEFTLDLPLAPAAGAAGAGDTAGAARPSLRVVVIGGVTAGPKAAAKIIRLVPDADVTIVDRGAVLSYASCGLPYYVAGVVRDQKSLISSPSGVVRDPVFFSKVKNVHVHNRTEALALDRAGKRVRVRDLRDGRESWLPYDKLLLATGASAFVPEALRTPLANVFTLHGPRDAEGIRAAVGAGPARDVVIVGGGLIGIEMTEALARKGARVTVVERLPNILPIVDPELAALVERHLEANGVRVLTGTGVEALLGAERVTGVRTARGDLPADAVILACGIRPNSELAAAAGLALGFKGAIQVDARMATSDPDIYAAGDCAATVNLVTGAPSYFPLGSTAIKQGRAAAVNLCGGEDMFPGVVESCICKVFDYAVARTGLRETEARAPGRDVLTVLAPGLDRAHFLPGARMVLLKLVVDRASRRLLGAQATGPGACDKRIDAAAMAVAAGLTIDQLAQSDLCYAAPYASAMDNLITAANVARNKLAGLYEAVGAEEVAARLKAREDLLLLDVRTPEEHEDTRMPGSVLVPLGALRARLTEVPRDRAIVTVCDVGQRAYEAALILRAAGYPRVRVLEGGLAMWPYDTVA